MAQPEVRKKLKVTDEQKKLLIENEGQSLLTLSRMLGVSEPVISRWMYELGLKIYSKGPRTITETINDVAGLFQVHKHENWIV